MIRRYLSDDNLKRVKIDFKFLVNLVKESLGEYDLAIRDDYFNIYYKGNSLAKVSFSKQDKYQISIHRKFFDNTKADNPKYYLLKNLNKDYWSITLTRKEIHPFLQKKHLDEFASRIKAVNYGEEIGFEQALITDNLYRTDFIFIDRQVTDSGLRRKRMDLLALKEITKNQYQFIIVEVKLGNNPELSYKVALQLNNYISHINSNFSSYKKCYEKHYCQKFQLGLINSSLPPQININEPVSGLIVVGGYSGIANKRIAQLNSKYPGLKVKHFKYVL